MSNRIPYFYKDVKCVHNVDPELLIWLTVIHQLYGLELVD